MRMYLKCFFGLHKTRAMLVIWKLQLHKSLVVPITYHNIKKVSTILNEGSRSRLHRSIE
uniref:Uncharacterized protein n=1 Tax=Arundo donax TaxID=35708 RepID=A0A0A8Z4Q7_ARUDO